MKLFKISLTVATFLCVALGAKAQSYKNTFKLGVIGGMALPSENASAHVGADLAYQNLVSPHVGLGIASGYNHFFGRSHNGLDNNSFGVIPVAGLIRFYPASRGFYLGSDLGYGFITGNEKVAKQANVDMPGGGFYIKPEIGYHNKQWNVFVHYNKVFTGDKGSIGDQKFNAGALGLGVAYNLPLGR